jgi:hypothetical protein
MKKLAVISDVDLGFGSPQTVSVSKAIAAFLGADVSVIHPVVHGRITTNDNQGVQVKAVTTRAFAWSDSGRMEFLGRAREILNADPPDFLIINNYLMLPILDLIESRPGLVIHSALEEPPSHEDPLIDGIQWENIRRLSQKIDFWIFPETNRAIKATGLVDIPSEKQCVIYNLDPSALRASKGSMAHPVSPRLIYAGTIDLNNSVGKHFFSNLFTGVPIDFFGRLNGSPEQIDSFHSNLPETTQEAKYFGEVTHDELRSVLPSYAFSLIYWLPTNFSFLNAAPNKFFQAVAAGVPVICAPHPQCVELVNRYKCGIVADDWSLLALRSALNYAVSILGTEAYDTMEAGCARAVQEELNMATQVKRVSSK